MVRYCMESGWRTDPQRLCIHMPGLGIPFVVFREFSAGVKYMIMTNVKDLNGVVG